MTAAITEYSVESSRWGGYCRTKAITFKGSDGMVRLMSNTQEGCWVDCYSKQPPVFCGEEHWWRHDGRLQLLPDGGGMSQAYRDYIFGKLSHKSPAGIMRDGLVPCGQETPVELPEEEAIACLVATLYWGESSRLSAKKSAWNDCFPRNSEGQFPSETALDPYKRVLEQIREVFRALESLGAYEGESRRVAANVIRPS